MTVLFIILGFLMIGFGFSCMFTPLLTYMNAAYFLTILMTVFGVVGIVKSIKMKKFGVFFVFYILSVVLGIILLLSPGVLLFTETVNLIITAIWFVLLGVVTIFSSITVTRKASRSKIWILQLILGILGVLVGLYSLFNPMLLALSIGTLIGIYFIDTGLTMMLGGFVSED